MTEANNSSGPKSKYETLTSNKQLPWQLVNCLPGIVHLALIFTFIFLERVANLEEITGRF